MESAANPIGPPRAGDAFAAGLACWYFSGLIVALALTFGLTFLPSARTLASGHLLDSLVLQTATAYLKLVDKGYDYDPRRESSVAFFPVYPLAARWVAKLGTLRSSEALFLVSNAAFLATLVVLYRYGDARCGGAAESWVGYSGAAAALFPTGCFFRFAYSESTFLLLAALSLLGIERRWPPWLVAGIVGLATAARPVGVALLVPLALWIWVESPTALARAARLPAFLLLGSWGLLAYMVFQWERFGAPFAFALTQRHYGYRSAPPLLEHLTALASLEPIVAVYSPESEVYWAKLTPSGIPWFSLQFANPLFFVGAVALLVVGAWRGWLNRYEWSAGAFLLLIPYLTRSYEMGMNSMGRFVAVAFPIYFVIGRLLARLPRELAAMLLACMAAYLALYSALYAGNHHIS